MSFGLSQPDVEELIQHSNGVCEWSCKGMCARQAEHRTESHHSIVIVMLLRS